MLKRVKYTSEFREEAVKLALSSDTPQSITAGNLGVNKNTLYNWIRHYMQEKTILSKPASNITAKYLELEKENKELKSKLKRAESEREILKKAAAYFASQDL